MHLVWAGKQTTEPAGHREKKDDTKRKIIENNTLQKRDRYRHTDSHCWGKHKTSLGLSAIESQI